jgi:polysaccharide export outer membrane protein
MKVKILFLFALTFGLFQVTFGQDVALAQDDLITPEESSGYLIGPGDKIVGQVLGEPEFNFESIIDEDGKFQVNFFEKGVVAKCRTEKEVRNDVTQLLSKYLKNPQVSVRVIERNSRPPATIYGEVRKPQEIILRRKATLLEILSVAGGETDKAGGLIQVTRTKPPMCSENEENWLASEGQVPSRHYSLSSLRSGRADSNPIIFPGDIIVVPEAPPVYVVGEVNLIGKDILVPENGLPLTQAISQAGGLSRQAKTKNVRIYRQVEGSPDPQIISVNYELIRKGEQNDIMLQPYDIVEVDKSKKSIGEILLGIATGGVTSFTNVLPQRVLY